MDVPSQQMVGTSQVEVCSVNTQLTLDLENDDAQPYFLWSEEMNLRTLKEILAGDQGEYLQWVYSGRILREAKVKDVWRFFAPSWINQNWSKLSPYLGHKRNFWRQCLDVWVENGLLS
jgi:hypothetical protein